MENNENSLSIFKGTGKVYTSLKSESIEDKKKIYNASKSCDVFLKDIKGQEIEIKDGKQKTSIKKVFPGYVLVKMIMTDETWYVIKSIKGVFSFVGTGDKPLPLTEKEMISLGIGVEVLNLDFEEGDSVTIITEPFYNYPGTIEAIDKEKQRVVVKVNMFNRETTVELGFDQIQKI